MLPKHLLQLECYRFTTHPFKYSEYLRFDLFLLAWLRENIQEHVVAKDTFITNSFRLRHFVFFTKRKSKVSNRIVQAMFEKFWMKSEITSDILPCFNRRSVKWLAFPLIFYAAILTLAYRRLTPKTRAQCQ